MLFRSVVADADLIAEYDALADQRVGRMSTFQGPIDQAWKIIVERLIGDTRLPYMNRAPTALRETHLHLALAKLFQSFGLNADGNHWRELAKIEHDRYEGAFARISLQLDQNQDGLVDNPLARSAGTGTISFNGGQPRYSLRGTFGRYGL